MNRTGKRRKWGQGGRVGKEDTYRLEMFFVVHHYHKGYLLVPDHLPEISDGVPQGMLGNYVTLLPFVVLLCIKK